MPTVTWNALLASSLSSFVLFVLPNFLTVGSTTANIVEIGEQASTSLTNLRRWREQPGTAWHTGWSIVAFFLSVVIALWLSLFNLQIGAVTLNALTSALGLISLLYTLARMSSKRGQGASRFDAIRGIQLFIILLLIAIIITIVPRHNAITLPQQVPHGVITIKAFPVANNTAVLPIPTSTITSVIIATTPTTPIPIGNNPTPTATIAEEPPTAAPHPQPTATQRPTSIPIPTATPIPPRMVITRSSQSDQACGNAPDKNFKGFFFTVTNSGGQNLNWTVSFTDDFPPLAGPPGQITFTPMSASIVGGSSENVTLSGGDQANHIYVHFESNGGSDTETIGCV